MKTGTHRQSTPLEVAYSTLIRIDENRFVSDEQVCFNEPAIDDVLDTIAPAFLELVVTVIYLNVLQRMQ